MVHVVTFPVEMPSIVNFFQPLGTDQNNRYYYISKNFLREFFKITKEKNGYKIFMEEITNGKLPVMDVVSSWLGIEREASIDLSMEEMATFVDLINVSGKTDVYENLMEIEIDGSILGQDIFINALGEIIRRCRDGA